MKRTTIHDLSRNYTRISYLRLCRPYIFMEQIRAIIIDDDPECREQLQEMLEKYCPEVNVLTFGIDAKQGLSLIRSLHPELVFLDVQMPGMDGFEMLESLDEVDFEVIFTTVHEQFALKAIKFAAIDYLVKPVNKEDLLVAVRKIRELEGRRNPNLQWQAYMENKFISDSQQKKIALPTGNGFRFVPLKEIYRLEAASNYVNFFLKGGESMLVTQTLKSYELLLKDHDFFRIHYSHMINLNYIKAYVRDDGGYVVMEDDKQLPVAKNRRKIFLQRIKHLV